jgi:hypothetical protein
MNLWAKRWNGSSWVYYILFAGHAEYENEIGAPYVWRHNDVQVGWINRSSFWEAATKNIFNEWETNSDSSRVYVTSSAHWSLRNNWFYRSGAEKAFPLSYKFGSNQYAVGDVMCKSGIGYMHPQTESYSPCGTVIGKNYTQWSQRCCQDNDDIKVYNLNRADFNYSLSGYGLSGGDSGAIVHGGWENGGSGSGWAGIAGPNQLGFYSLPGKIESDLQVTVCLNEDCSN